MAPSREPIQELILQNIEAALKLIQGGSDYYTTVPVENVVRTEYSGPHAMSFPRIEIATGPTEYDTDPRITRVLRQRNAYMTVEARIMLQDRSTSTLAIHRFIADCEKAFHIDRRRGQWTSGRDSAMDSWLARSDPFYPADPREPVCGADLTFVVWYRTELEDTTQTG